jgi:hypothetical protein
MQESQPEVENNNQQTASPIEAVYETGIQALISEASYLKHQIDTAKTSFKRDFYSKKFKKTIVQLQHLSQKMDRVKKVKE